MKTLTNICIDCGTQYGVGRTVTKRLEWTQAICDKCGELTLCLDAVHWGLDYEN